MRVLHKQVPATCDEKLEKSMSAYIQNASGPALDMYGYGQQSKSVSSAVSGKDLLLLQHLVMALYAVQPALRFKRKQLEKLFLKMIRTFPEKKLNGTKYPDWTFAFFVAKRIMVVLKHVQKLFTGTRLQECQSKMPTDAAEKLGEWIQGMANKVSLDPVKTTPRKRKLQREVSLDENGWPCMMATLEIDAECFDKCKPAVGTTAPDLLEAKSKELWKYAVSAAKEPLPSKKGDLKKHALEVPQSSANASDRRGDSKSFGTILMGPYGTKSYIRMVSPEGKVATNTLINVSGTPEHQQICWKLFHHLLKHDTTKEELIHMRDMYKEQVAAEDVLDSSDDEATVTQKILSFMED